MDNHCFLTGIFSIILILIVFPVQNIFSEQLFLLKFEAKAKTDVHVLLACCDGCNGHEIVIGGWNNQFSTIRQMKQSPVQYYVNVRNPIR